MNQLPRPCGELPHTGEGHRQARQCLPTRIRPTYHGAAGPHPAAGGSPHHEAGRDRVPQTKEGLQP